MSEKSRAPKGTKIEKLRCLIKIENKELVKEIIYRPEFEPL